MAFVNPNKPAGLSPVMYLNGANWDGKVNVYSILAANTNPFFPGDVVSLVAGGGATAGVNGIPAITLTTAGAAAVGVLVAVGNSLANLFPEGGPYANPLNLNIVNRPTGAQSVNYYAAVIDDPFVVFEVQEGGAGTNLTSAALGRNANLIYAAPATGVNFSGTMLDNGGVAVTATLNFKILRFARRIDNNFVTTPATGGGSQKWWVLINNHSYRTGIVSL